MSSFDNNILARKVRGPKMRVTGFPAMDPLCRAFASICGTRARSELRPGVKVSVFGFEVMRHVDYFSKLAAPSAIYLISFPGSAGGGLIKAHPRLLGKVLDIYLGGDGSFEESNFARALTGIDLAIYGRFVDLVMRAFDEATHEVCGRSAIGMPQKVKFEEQPGMVRIASDWSELFVIKLNFHMANDTRGAGLDFVIPIATLEPLKKDLISNESCNETTSNLWRSHMLEQVIQMRLPLHGAIGIGSFTVAELARLQPGDFIALPADTINRIELRLDTANGPKILARGRLGAADRHKAIRLSEDPDQEFLEPLVELLHE